MKSINDKILPYETKKKFRSKNILMIKGFDGIVMVLPACLLIIIFIIVPIFYGIYISLTRWSGFSPPEFIGFQNYIRIISRDAIFQKAILQNPVDAAQRIRCKAHSDSGACRTVNPE